MVLPGSSSRGATYIFEVGFDVGMVVIDLAAELSLTELFVLEFRAMVLRRLSHRKQADVENIVCQSNEGKLS